MENIPATCFNCGNDDHQLPLVQIQYKGHSFHICPGCMPSLIHRSETVADKIETAYLSKKEAKG